MADFMLLMIALDIAILALFLLWLLLRFRGRQSANAAAILEKCRELQDSLKELVQRAEHVSADIVLDIERERNLAGETLQKLQHERDEAHLLMDESQRVLGLSEQWLTAAQTYEPAEGKYEEALELHRKGLSREEILKRVAIADGELELVLNLHGK